MTIPQFIVAYSVCWWLILFMVLPHRADATPNPARGHAPSAPANPRLKQKFLWTTLLALLPTIAIYFFAANARADDQGIYTTKGGDCAPLASYAPSGDVNVRDGHGVGDKKVTPADMNQSTFIGSMDQMNIPLAIPTNKYIKNPSSNVDLSESFVQVGKLEVNKDGPTYLNGHSASDQAILNPDCVSKKE